MGITNHISQAATSREQYDKAFLEIVNAIQSEIRQYINAKYPRHMNGLPSVTDFVQQTFDKLQQNMRDDHEAFVGMTTKEFMTTVRHIAHNKIRDAKKSKTAKLQTEGDLQLQSLGSAAGSPADEATKRELAILILSLLLADQDPMEGLVSILGHGMGFSLRDIEETLKRSNDGVPVFSDSKILRILKQSKERTQKRLKELGEEVIGPLADD